MPRLRGSLDELRAEVLFEGHVNAEQWAKVAPELKMAIEELSLADALRVEGRKEEESPDPDVEHRRGR